MPQPGEAPPERRPLDVDGLCDLARQHGYSGVGKRTLEDWRYRRLMPQLEPMGQHGQRTIYQSPAGSGEQLLALCRWRAKVPRDLDAVRLLLWIDGFRQRSADIRDSLNASLQRTMAKADRELARLASTLAQGDGGAGQEPLIQLVADEAAKRRTGNEVAPGALTMRRPERVDAIKLMLRAFVFGEAVTVDRRQAKLFEKLLGIKAGRTDQPGGSGPWLTGPPDCYSRSVATPPSPISSARLAPPPTKRSKAPAASFEPFSRDCRSWPVRSAPSPPSRTPDLDHLPP